MICRIWWSSRPRLIFFRFHLICVFLKIQYDLSNKGSIKRAPYILTVWRKYLKLCFFFWKLMVQCIEWTLKSIPSDSKDKWQWMSMLFIACGAIALLVECRILGGITQRINERSGSGRRKSDDGEIRSRPHATHRWRKSSPRCTTVDKYDRGLMNDMHDNGEWYECWLSWVANYMCAWTTSSYLSTTL